MRLQASAAKLAEMHIYSCTLKGAAIALRTFTSQDDK